MDERQHDSAAHAGQPPETPAQLTQPSDQPWGHSQLPVPKQSGIGISSFVLAIAMIVIGMAGFITFTASIASQIPPEAAGDPAASVEIIERFTSEKAGVLAFFGISFLAFLLCGLIGLILGIAALFQRNRRKGFAIAGTVINGIAMLIVFLLLLIGIAAGAGM